MLNEHGEKLRLPVCLLQKPSTAVPVPLIGAIVAKAAAQHFNTLNTFAWLTFHL
jgi:hypothetical protein